MKTIFISAYHGFVARAIFNSRALEMLKEQSDLRIVIFAPPSKRDFFERQYGGHNVVVENFDLDSLVRTPKNKFWWRLGFVLLDTQYTRDQRHERLWRRQTVAGYLRYWWVSAWGWILSRIGVLRTIYRAADFYFSPRDVFQAYINQYQPALFFSTDIFSEPDSFFLRSAKASGIPTVGMVRSWDNPTTKGVLRIMPDSIMVNSIAIADDMVRFHGYSRKHISVVGLPQFDRWFTGPVLSREEFYTSIGADPSSRLIMFAPAGSGLSDIDWQFLEILKRGFAEDRLPSNLQILVRNHPAHPADLSRFTTDHHFIIEAHPGTHFGVTGYKDSEISPKDNEHLMHSVYYSSAIMYIATSLGLDATTFDKPQIIVSFDGWEKKPYPQSVQRFNHEDCLQGIIECGGTRVVKTSEEWFSAITSYLADPSIDRPGRTVARQRYLEPLDGRAGERIAHIIKQLSRHV